MMRACNTEESRPPFNAMYSDEPQLNPSYMRSIFKQHAIILKR
jgi:hypothetical protein